LLLLSIYRDAFFLKQQSMTIAVCRYRERFCGQALGFCRQSQGSVTACSPALGPVVSYAKPFVLGVVFDQDEGGPGTASNNPADYANRGFRLVYNQLPCVN
jgi:hypothetical protein